MNATLKAICGLLKRPEPDIQQSAIRVIGAIMTREPGVHKALGELLVETQNHGVFAAILDTIEVNPHEETLKYLLRVVEQDHGQQERVLNAVAHIGGKAVIAIKKNFDRLEISIQCRMVALLPRIRTSQAHSFLIDCFFSADHDLVREAVHSLREEIHNYDKKEFNDLQQRLTAALNDRRLKNNEAGLSALIIALGILADIRSKNKILPYVEDKYPKQIRRHALMSLARLEYSGDKHHGVFTALLPILSSADYEGLVRHAVNVLVRIKPRRADNGKIQDLLNNKHLGVKIYAINALSQIDSITNSGKIMEFMHSRETALRDAAGQALRQMPSAVTVILRAMDEEDNRARLFEMVRILEAHANRIKPDKAREMVKHMLDLYEKNDEHYQIYRTALRHLRGDVLQSELVKRATAARKKKDFEKVRDYLKLLDHTELLTPDIRFMLAVAKLKTSKKDHSRAFRLTDYCLEHISHLLREDAKDFKKKFLSEKALDPEDILYVGFHFSEQLNEERRFGADLLRHVAKKYGRHNCAKIAKKKLKVEGH